MSLPSFNFGRHTIVVRNENFRQSCHSATDFISRKRNKKKTKNKNSNAIREIIEFILM